MPRISRIALILTSKKESVQSVKCVASFWPAAVQPHILCVLFGAFLAIYQAGHVAGAESVVDIYRNHIGGAAI